MENRSRNELISKRLVRLRRRMAKRWAACHTLADPELITISQELDLVLYRFMADVSERPEGDTVELDKARNR